MKQPFPVKWIFFFILCIIMACTLLLLSYEHFVFGIRSLKIVSYSVFVDWHHFYWCVRFPSINMNSICCSIRCVFTSNYCDSNVYEQMNRAAHRSIDCRRIEIRIDGHFEQKLLATLLTHCTANWIELKWKCMYREWAIFLLRGFRPFIKHSLFSRFTQHICSFLSQLDKMVGVRVVF